MYKQLFDSERRVHGADSPAVAGAKLNYSNLLAAMGRHSEAVVVIKDVFDMERRMLGDDHPDTLKALHNYGDALHGVNRFAESADVLKRAWYGERQVLGESHLETTNTAVDYCNTLVHLGRDAEAADVMKQLWEAYRRDRGDDDPMTRARRHDYATTMRQLGRPVDLPPATQPTLTSSGAAHTLFNQAVYLAQCGDTEDALPMVRCAADFYRRSAPDDAGRGPALYYLGSALAGEHQWADAEAVLRENWAFDQSHPAPDREPGTVPGSLKLLNRCLKAEGKPAEPTTGPATRP